MKTSTKQVLGYALLPRVIPMIRDLLKPGFGLVALSMAQIYAGCGLLPRNHPYLNSHNTGRFGISSVMLEAMRNLKFTRKHMDQVFIFLLLACGIFLLAAQFFILGIGLFSGMAHAAFPTTYSGFFVTASPTDDIAYMLMDRVFGIDSTPPMFNSCLAQHVVCLNAPTVETWPLPYHAGLHDMLSFYSMGLAVIGLIIFMYYAVAVFLETAESGTPFGKRFNHVWAPIRMVVALGLLIPLSYGFNGAQLMTLLVAKWGSSFATNGWFLFVDTMTSAGQVSVLDADNNLVASPQDPGPRNLFKFFTVLSACDKLYKRNGITIKAYVAKGAGAAASSQTIDSMTWQDALNFYDKGDIIVLFGEKDTTKYSNEKGDIMPWCGELSLDAVDLTQPGAVTIQTAYWDQIIKAFWKNADTGAVSGFLTGLPAATLPAPNSQRDDYFFHAADRTIEMALGQIQSSQAVKPYPNAMYPNQDAANDLLQAWYQNILAPMTQSHADQVASDWTGSLKKYGWAGAGIWYNKIAEMNGGYITAIGNLPSVRKWPMALEAIAEENAKANADTPVEDRFKIYSQAGNAINLPTIINRETAEALSKVYTNTWETIPQNMDSAGTYALPPHITQNALTAFLEQLFGLRGLFQMTSPQNQKVQPLAQIVTLGKYLMAAAIRNVLMGAAGTLSEKILGGSNVGKNFAAFLAIIMTRIGMMTLSLGFVLYYVVPFMPFLYFFFQVGGWIKALFEAMVGLPLWALAHIRIDGDGLPGGAAMNGYYLILEIFLRPILTIFGLLGGIVIFAAQVTVLHEIFNLVVSNVSGFDSTAAASIAAGTAGWYGYYRGYVDELFYTVIYVLIVYMMGTSSFKLIYMIPDKTMRWMGANIESFGDEIGRSHPENLVGKMYGGTTMAVNQIGSGLLRS